MLKMGELIPKLKNRVDPQPAKATEMTKKEQKKADKKKKCGPLPAPRSILAELNAGDTLRHTAELCQDSASAAYGTTFRPVLDGV